MMLKLDRISAGYGRAQVLFDLNLDVGAGEILCLFGRNGAGKTTTLRTIMGLVPLDSGTITLDGGDISALPAHDVPKAGVGYVPQGRRLFGELSVAQNLSIGLMARKRGRETRERVLTLFPRLRERLNPMRSAPSPKSAALPGSGTDSTTRLSMKRVSKLFALTANVPKSSPPVTE